MDLQQDESDLDSIQLVGVIGGGLMGSGIAEVSARSGHDVVVIESARMQPWPRGRGSRGH